MRSVALVIPPSPFLLDERVFVSLGVLSVAASLEAAGVAVDVLDLSGVSNYLDAARAFAVDTDTEVIGVTATTPQMPAAVAVAEAIHEERPGLRLVLGGPHATMVNAARKGEVKRGERGRAHRAMDACATAFDVVVAGDGEHAALAACEPGAPALIDADDPASPLFLGRADLETMPLPARHLVDLDSYHYAIDGACATSVIAQLGCPFECAFCGGRASPSFRRMRQRSTERVVSEVCALHEEYGYAGFMFYDDELNVSRAMVPLMERLADLQESLGVDFRMRGFVKAELLTSEQAGALYRAGFRWILCGFESGSARILRNINKKATRDDNSRCLDTARAAGLKVKALMSIGHAGETEETVSDTRDWLLETAPDDFDATIITTYPGCPYYDQAHETDPGVWTFETHGDRLHAREVDYTTTADYYKGDPDGGYRSHVWTDALSAERLVELRGALETEVRAKLGIPFNQSRASVLYEHSMGQGLPSSILRQTGVHA